MRRLAISLVLLACAGIANAGAPVSGPREALISWSPPLNMTDSSVIPPDAPLQYHIYRSTSKTVCDTTSIATTSALTLLLTNQPLGEQCYCVTVSLYGSFSAPSGPACKIMRLPAPTEGSIEAPTEGSIER